VEAIDVDNYAVKPGKVVSASVDGNLVKLVVEGRPTSVTAKNLTDDPERRFFKGHPAVAMEKPATVQVEWLMGDG
jgi:hypothetical protein